MNVSKLPIALNGLTDFELPIRHYLQWHGNILQFGLFAY